jgi:choline dehydrogenase
VSNDAFDLVIVGAGSAGCVLADRMSANGRLRVCLLEGGGSTNLHPLVRIPAGWAATFNHRAFDWGYTTEPEPGLNGRALYWPRGRGLGGSSAINGMIYIRGHAIDFERWAQAGAEGWNYEGVLPYFRRAETQATHHDDYHGTDGPQHVQDSRDPRPIHEAFIEAMMTLGIPRNADFNGADQTGGGYYQFTQRAGSRWTTADGYLGSARKRPNLRIEAHALARKVLFNGKRATGVRILQRGQERDIHARHVVLCGGAINSPQLLELSGIGNPAHLRALGIPVVHALPDVGEHLQDHLLSKVVYGTHEASSINREVQGWRLGLSALNWLLRRRGPLSAGSALCGGFAYTREDAAAPDVQFFFASGATLFNANGKIKALPIPAITCACYQSRPESRGSVHIRSAEPDEHPRILANYLATELDRTTLVRGVRLIERVFNADAMKPYITGRMSPVADLDMNDDTALLAHVRADGGTGYHPTSTCAIGKVVDPRLSVYGVAGLSVADASVMPYVVSGNTNAAAIMIGEKASDLLADTLE